MKIRSLDIDSLLLMVYMSDGLSVGEVAKKMNITQPAVSQRLKSLANILGYPLHIKYSIRTKLTAEGEALAVVCREVLRLLISVVP